MSPAGTDAEKTGKSQESVTESTGEAAGESGESITVSHAAKRQLQVEFANCLNFETALRGCFSGAERAEV